MKSSPNSSCGPPEKTDWFPWELLSLLKPKNLGVRPYNRLCFAPSTHNRRAVQGSAFTCPPPLHLVGLLWCLWVPAAGGRKKPGPKPKGKPTFRQTNRHDNSPDRNNKMQELSPEPERGAAAEPGGALALPVPVGLRSGQGLPLHGQAPPPVPGAAARAAAVPFGSGQTSPNPYQPFKFPLCFQKLVHISCPL